MKKEITYEEICRNIRARNFSPIYLLMGEEPFFIDKISGLLIDIVLDESEKAFNQTIFYGSDITAAQVINAAKRFPMMSEYQLVVVREAQLLKDIDLLANYAKNPLMQTILVIDYKYKKYDRRKALATAADDKGVLFESKKVPDYKLNAFITSFLKEEDVNIDAKSAQMLSDFLGNDLTRLTKELEKLMILIPENAFRQITPEMIEENIGISKDFNNFELIKALASKDVLKANRIAGYFAKNPKSNPIQMTLPVLFNYFSNLLICYYSKDKSERGLMEALGLRLGFQVQDYLIGLKNYSAMKAFSTIGEIRNTDARSKGVGNASATDADLLKELLYKILH